LKDTISVLSATNIPNFVSAMQQLIEEESIKKIEAMEAKEESCLVKKSSSKENPINFDEAAAINLYTASAILSGHLNNALREADQGIIDPYLGFIKLLFSGLCKLPLVQKETIACGVEGDLSTKFKKGEDMVWWSFTSTTINLEVMSDFAKGGTIFIFHSAPAVHIKPFSRYQYEEEWLILPGTCFKVESVDVILRDDLKQITQITLSYNKEMSPLTTHMHKWSTAFVSET
jgi:hypothetical protein